MALPTVKTLSDCADFSLTVSPFIPQLVELPSTVLSAGLDLSRLKEVYLSTNPLVSAVALSLVLGVFFLVLSEITGNYSQVDRAWSFIPGMYNAHFVAWSRLNGIPTERTISILIVTALWGARLTFNYWRKGGYQKGHEDYRWEILREQLDSRALVLLLNVTFISFGQMILLLLVTMPTYVCLLLETMEGGTKFGLSDLVFSRVLFFLIIIEYVADQQQWDFHVAKQEYQVTAKVPERYKSAYTNDDLSRGFVVSSLWALCRHPNFVAEQLIWVILYLWSCFQTGSYINWSASGVLCYLLLFQGSTKLTEDISASKYPEYRDYQARVGMFIPRWGVTPSGGSSAPASKDEQKPSTKSTAAGKTKKAD